MGIRESINEDPQSAFKAVSALIGLALLLLIWHLLPTRHAAIVTREYYSADDGDTWFVDDGTELPPFDHDGSQAVLAKVFRCHSGYKFVGYLEKFTEDAQKRITAARANGTLHGGTAAMEAVAFNGVLIKKPHEGKWVSINDPAAVDVKTFACPNGSRDYLPLTP